MCTLIKLQGVHNEFKPTLWGKLCATTHDPTQAIKLANVQSSETEETESGCSDMYEDMNTGTNTQSVVVVVYVH